MFRRGRDSPLPGFVPPLAFPSAQRVAELDKLQFQPWVLSLNDARPLKEGDGKGAGPGVDGLLNFYESKEERRKIIVQVKGGGVKRGDVAIPHWRDSAT